MNNVVILALKMIVEITITAWLDTVSVECSSLVLICTMLRVEPRPLHTIDQYSTTELQPSPF